MKRFPVLTYVAPIACALLLPSERARAQSAVASGPVSIQVGSAAESTTYNSLTLGVHALGVAGSTNRPIWSNALTSSSSVSFSIVGAANALIPSIAAVPPPGFYPADVSNPGNGPTVLTAASHPLYVDCADTCWGSPATFLENLGKSTFIHVADQYVGSTTNDRYTVGKAANVTYAVNKTLYDSDILAIVHAGGKAFGTGYNQIYHVFLPKGVDVCVMGTNQCYSPDNPSTFFFCAYHASVTFSDIGHTLFTVQPYQDVAGCSVAPGSPNGALVDSTSSVLSHELFETITDPDGKAYWQHSSLLLYGAEIADLCEAIEIIGPNVYFSYGVVSLNSHPYEVQPMYSNGYHACAYVPL
jgi:hypothetical protein